MGGGGGMLVGTPAFPFHINVHCREVARHVNMPMYMYVLLIVMQTKVSVVRYYATARC
jgi:hypothetical protein